MKASLEIRAVEIIIPNLVTHYQSLMKIEAIRLDVEVLEERIAPSIVLCNPGGNTPQGGGANNGQAIQNVNPAGHAPGGHN